MENIFDTLIKVLKNDERFFSEDGVLLRNRVVAAANANDEQLLKLLLADKTIRQQFFTEVDGIVVFNQRKFDYMVNNRQFLPDSYTRFKNKIGLADRHGELLVSQNDVELIFPYKDCFLEGGQTKDDQKRDEIFYNETLAPEQVDRLLYPKVLVGAKRYTKDGAAVATQFRDADNLIIKGNNLLAISSLLKRFERRIKLINIDPPYNTGSDSFGYNDAFKHSTWLVFMKNRLELAKRLLRPDGFITCQINETESYHLKVLMDEIFGRDNYLATLFVKVRYAEKTLKQDMDFHKEVEQIFVYRASAAAKPNFDRAEVGLDKYIYYFKETGTFSTVTLDGKRVDIFPQGNYEIIEGEATEDGLKEIWASGTILDGNSSGRFFRDFLTGRAEKDGLSAMYKVYGIGDDKFDYRYFTGPQRATATKGKYYQGVPKDQLTGKTEATLPINSFYDLSGSFGNCRHEGGVELRSGKKPEILYGILFKHFSNPQEIILDFFLGSGTTAAVAHKMNRQYIGIEQLDYGTNDSVERLNNVIEGDSTGISKDANWQGGGSFVYCELAKCNQGFIEAIEAAESNEELAKLFDIIINSDFISCKVNPREVATSAGEFAELSMDDKKRFLMLLLDKNMLYVNLCDLDDEDYRISENDKAFTKSFYGEK